MDNQRQINEFSRVFKDLVFSDFFLSSIKEGKPSSFLLGTSKHLHRIFKGRLDRKDLEDMEREFKATAEELAEIIKTTATS